MENNENKTPVTENNNEVNNQSTETKPTVKKSLFAKEKKPWEEEKVIKTIFV